MKIVNLVLTSLFILCLPWILVTAALRIPANCPAMYEYLFNKYDAGITTGLDKTALKETAHGLVRYFNNSEEYIDLVVMKDGKPFQLFNEREVIHLKDVKALFRLDLYVLIGTLAFALVYLFWNVARGGTGYRSIARGALTGSVITLGLMIVLGAGLLFNFDGLLLRFHLLSFTNDFWLLDPAHDYLIMLVTGGFMYDASFLVAGAAAAGALVTGLTAWVYLRRR